MRRHTARPFGQAIPPSRLFSLLLALGVIWMLYNRLGDPAMWKFVGFRDDVEPVTVTAAKTPTEPENELVVPGPNDLDEDEFADFQRKLEMVVNRKELLPREMLLYWQLMEWACTQTTRDLEKRALKDIIFRQIWEEPEKYQGKLIQLRIHAQQTVRYDTPKNDKGELTNSVGLKEVFETWGPTDDAVPFHYVVVFPEKPAALKLGEKGGGEIVFTGYFLKLMQYDARDGKKRGAPLLIGRVRMAGSGVATKPAGSDSTALYFTLAILGIVVAVGLYALITFRSRQQNVRKPLPYDLPELTLGGTDSLADRPFVIEDITDAASEPNVSAGSLQTATTIPSDDKSAAAT